jgi:ABC-2 type transport system permease protein
VTPRLFLRIASTEARRKMSYRADFWIQAFVVIAVEAGIYWFLWHSVFRESGRAGIGGYTLHGIILYSMAALLLGRVIRGPEFESAVMEDIYEGGLNRYIVYPTRYFGFKYAAHFGAMLPIAVQAVLFGAAMPFLLGLDPTVVVTPATVAMAVVSTLVANLLYYLVGYAIQGVAFWADNVWSLRVLQRFATAILGGGLLPLSLFPEWSRPILYVLPFPYMYGLPVETLLGRVDPLAWLGNLGVAFAWCGAFAWIGRSVFRRGYLQYSGIGI